MIKLNHRLTQTVATAAAGGALALALAAVANASGGQDDNFLAMLARAGIPAHDGIPGVISYGHKVCEALDSGESASALVDTLANHAYSEDPSFPLDRYQRTMTIFVRVSAQAYCPGHSGNVAAHGGYRIVLAGVNGPEPSPALPQVPNAELLIPPPVAAPKRTPPPEQKPPPPEQKPPPPPQVAPPVAAPEPKRTPPPEQKPPPPPPIAPAPEPPEGHITLAP